MHISRSCVVFAKTIELNAERFISMDSAALFRTSPIICSLVLSSFTTPPTFLFFFFFGYGTLLRFLRADSLSVHRSTLICFFSLVFLFQLDFIFVLESFIIQFSHFSLVLLSSSSSLYHPPRAPPFILQLLILKL